MSTLPYPAWWRRQAGERRSVLDSTVESLKSYCASEQSIIKVLVFGSYATGNVGPKSDLDIIVVQESQLPQVTRTAELYVRLRPLLAASIDLIVYTPEEFERLAATRSFVIDAVAHGTWIYARASA